MSVTGTIVVAAVAWGMCLVAYMVIQMNAHSETLSNDVERLKHRKEGIDG